MFISGWFLPPVISQEVPWRYTYSWRRDEAMHVGPDDVTRQMLSELGTSGELPKRYFVDNGYEHTLPYVPQLRSAATSGTVFNVTSASLPGEVVIVVGTGGSDQLMACLRYVRDVWRIVDVRDNLSCEDFRDD
jgi:hypothetical protein